MKQKLINLFKKDYRHYICVLITLIFIFLAIFYFKYSHIRIIESLRDFGLSFVYYFKELFEIPGEFNITVNKFTTAPYQLPFNLPNTWDEFKILCDKYLDLLFAKQNFKNYMKLIADIIYYGAKILTLLVPLILIFFLILQNDNVNNDHAKESCALKKWKKFEDKIYLPIKYWIIQFINFVNEHNYYKKIWFFIWLYNFQFIAIIIEFIAYYLYFVASFNFLSLYIQVLKLLMDLSIIIDFLPGIAWFTIFLILINILRRKIGFDYLNRLERRDRGFINDRTIVIMLCGTMGKKKTTIITDIALTQEIILRDKAFELLLENDLKFPDFPWIRLELFLKRMIKKHYIFNLATIEKVIENIKNKFLKHPSTSNIFGYDFEKYDLYFNNGLYIEYIWDVIKDYSKLYFIYIIESSLLISNYSIRTDNVLSDLGNFPLWNNDFFKKNPRLIDAYSRHAHILDFDMVRLGIKMIEENNKANIFEFGVINITEVGKERGNQLELQHISKKSNEANQKNDLFNYFLKMCRHIATVNNYPFVKIITDEQRPESLGSDARDLAEIVYIDTCSDMELTMPLFDLENLVISFLFDKFISSYTDFRYKRGDYTLPMYLYKNFICKIYNYRKRIFNQFGYLKLDLQVEKGTMDEGIAAIKDCNYYLMFKKIYSKRFSTDCFSDIFTFKKLKSKLGLNDLEEFETEKASFEEMLKENSYFFNELVKIRDS